MVFKYFLCTFAQSVLHIMIKLILHCADIHIRNFQRLDEYAEELKTFMSQCKELASEYKQEEVRILISGDILHQKLNISPELIVFVSSFLRELEKIAKVIVISGNHDLVVNNTSRKDSLTAIFDTASFENSIFLDEFLDYQSGVLIDENITWALYSIHDGFSRPDIEMARAEHPENTVVGLYHGVINGATLNNGTVMDGGVDMVFFEGCDIVMAGDIHKRQTLKRGDVIIVYPGSLIQQNFGETVTQHGFVKWDMQEKTHEFVDVPTDYGLYDIEISSIEDIDNDNEQIRNL